jgi:hypothetical protein
MTVMVMGVHLQLWLPRLCCENTHLGNVKSLFNSNILDNITKARPIDKATLLLIYRSSVEPLN